MKLNMEQAEVSKLQEYQSRR
ncbi:uncharacterized protein ARMOST_14808 [Armillaria ostoyae]|uniref:Uncharacterized protein n=1 Tax=Armillaria ostoyae TaxID=47428 RepID=A0A284RRU8_ARMOS|nr:uncharacterized protein ARMOST_14808 [Armillaria ostoyae]